MKIIVEECQENILDNELEYGIRLCTSGQLEFEEMIKIISIVNETENLIKLGLPYNRILHNTFVDSLTNLVKNNSLMKNAINHHENKILKKSKW